MNDNFGYMGRRNPLRDLDQIMWHVGRYGGRNHVCTIWWLSVKGCEFGEKGKFALSHWLEVMRIMRVMRSYNTGHTTVWPCDFKFTGVTIDAVDILCAQQTRDVCDS